MTTNTLNHSIDPNMVKFNSHKWHNPHCDILELKINDSAFITYYIDINTGDEGMEYYSGSNYVVGSSGKSTSFNYRNNIPKKYSRVWNELRAYYIKTYKNA